MTLTDAGPLVALIDSDEPDHRTCVATLDRLRLPLVTTWPAFTEAMHLVGRVGGWSGQKALWRLVSGKVLVIDSLSAAASDRTAGLMETYADRPMALADATLVALAEQRGLTRIFSLDSDFHVYRLEGNRSFDVVPA